VCYACSKHDEVVVSANPSHPAATLYRLSESSVRKYGLSLVLPPISLNLHNVRHVRRHLSDRAQFDLYGMVTFVGRVHREYSTTYKRFFEYRWVCVADDSSPHTLSVKVFPNSNELLFHGYAACMMAAFTAVF
jgi:hypothetical protein